MKEAYRHAPVTKERPNKLVKRVSRVASPKKDEQKRFNAPIFNGPLAGTHSHYIRPFDPVWPLDSEIQN